MINFCISFLFGFLFFLIFLHTIVLCKFILPFLYLIVSEPGLCHHDHDGLSGVLHGQVSLHQWLRERRIDDEGPRRGQILDQRQQDRLRVLETIKLNKLVDL